MLSALHYFNIFVGTNLKISGQLRAAQVKNPLKYQNSAARPPLVFSSKMAMEQKY